MSGETIPYQLRQNKAIDRYAFAELLSKLDKYCDISKYSYIGFGGHSLEDFKHIHTRFDIQTMTSIEVDKEVYKRQKFNQPHSCINCILVPSGQFIEDFDRTGQTIIWLDYTKPSQLRDQIEEFQATLDRLQPFDVVKLTLNAHAASYVPQEGREPDETWQARLEDLRKKLGDLFPLGSVNSEMMTTKLFPHALNLVVKHAASLSMRGQRKFYFQPLTAFSYSDGQTMLTVTGIILVDSLTDEFFGKTSIKAWELSNIDWSEPKRINVPNLTLKEKLHIDALLPNSDAKDIQDKLGFMFDIKEKMSLEMLKTYILFYRQSPYFSRISL